MRLSRCELRDHINCRKNNRWPSYRFYRALQRLKSPMRYICETAIFEFFNTIRQKRASLVSANGGSRFGLRSSSYGGQVANPTLRPRETS